MKKRLLSLMLSICLVVGLLPTGAAGITLPQNPANPQPGDQVQYEVADSGTRAYAPFEKAWNAVAQSSKGGTVTLIRNVTAADAGFGKKSVGFGSGGDIIVPKGKTITLDLNGFTLDRGLSASRENGSVLTVQGTLTLKDGSKGKTGKITGGNTAGSGGGIRNGGTLNLEGGTITGNGAAQGGGIYNNGSLFMTGGTVTQNIGGGVHQAKNFTVSGAAKVTDNQATLDGGKVNVYLPAGKKISVKDLKDGALIGVTTETLPTLDKPVQAASAASGAVLSAADLPRLPSDADYLTEIADNRLLLKLPSPPAGEGLGTLPTQADPQAAQQTPSAQPAADPQSAAGVPAESAAESAPEEYAVSFYPEKGVLQYPQTDGMRRVKANSPIGKLPEPKREGYVFAGWFTTPSDQPTVPEDRITEDFLVNLDLKLYAHWENAEAEIKFNLGGSKEGETPEPITVIFGGTYGAPKEGAFPVDPIRTGYKFAGWFTDDNRQITPESKVIRAGRHTLTAHWEADGVPVTLDENYGSHSVTYDHAAEYGETYGSRTPLRTPKRTGYDFQGWYTEPEDGKRVTDSTKVTDTEPHTLYAHWKVKTIEVKFDQNYSGAPSATTVRIDYGQPYGEGFKDGRLPEPTRVGAEFVGWFTKAKGGEQIRDNTLMEKETPHTLYALWQGRGQLEITFDPNGGDGSPEIRLTDTRGNLQLPDISSLDFTAPYGMQFQRWAIDYPDGKKASANTNHKFTEDTTVYAVWTEAPESRSETESERESRQESKRESRQESVRETESERESAAESRRESRQESVQETEPEAVSSPESAPESTPESVPESTPESVPESTPESVSESAPESVPESTPESVPESTPESVPESEPESVPESTPESVPESIPEEDFEIELFDAGDDEYWNLTYHAENGTDMTATDKAAKGAATTVLECTFLPPEGKVFDQWSIGSRDSQVRVGEKELYSFTADTDLYAQWKDSPPDTEYVTVTYHSDSADSVPPKTIRIPKGSLRLPSYDTYFTPPDTSIVVPAWRISADVNAERYRVGTTIDVTGNMNLYPVWSEASSTNVLVVFAANGGSVTPNFRVIAYGATCDQPVPTRAGCYFMGWYTEPEGGTKVPKDQKYTRDTVLYARWGYDVTYRSRGSRLLEHIPTYVQYVLPDGALKFNTPAGKVFDYWTIDGVRYDVGASYPLEGPVDILAVWRDIDEDPTESESEPESNPESESESEPEPDGDDTPIQPADTVTIIYQINGTIIYEFIPWGSDFVIPAGPAAPSGKVFDGWIINGTRYQPNDVIPNVTDSLTLQAAWRDGDTPGGDNPGGNNPGGNNPGGNNPGGDNPGGDNPGGDNPGGDNPGGDNPGGDNPGGDNPGGDNPGGDNPGGDNPGGDTPGVERPDNPPTESSSETSPSENDDNNNSNNGSNGGGGGGSASRPAGSGISHQTRPSTSESKSESTAESTAENPAESAAETTNTGYIVIRASADTGGRISPVGQVRVQSGSSQSFSITADTGYALADVVVDGISIGAVAYYTFENVRQEHTIRAIFIRTGEAVTQATTQTAGAAAAVPTARASTGYRDCPRDQTCPIWPYEDAQPTAWYHDGVHYCIDEGLMTGVDLTHFAPTVQLTRAMLAQILFNHDGAPDIDLGSSGFSDVPAGAWFEEAVDYVAGTALMSGYEDGRFGPNDPVTREQLVVVLWRHAGSPASGVSVPLSDFFSTRSFADEAMRWAYGRGIITGKDTGLLDPGGRASRAEVAQMLKSYFDSLL